jgi:hypothetical protein
MCENGNNKNGWTVYIRQRKTFPQSSIFQLNHLVTSTFFHTEFAHYTMKFQMLPEVRHGLGRLNEESVSLLTFVADPFILGFWPISKNNLSYCQTGIIFD